MPWQDEMTSDTFHAGHRSVLQENLDACSACGLCLVTCPTFALAHVESEGPRGRILLMRGVVDGRVAAKDVRASIDSCLRCGRCISACPTGVDLPASVAGYFREVDRRQTTGMAARMATLRARVVHLGRATLRRLLPASSWWRRQ
jgi:glycolate oxidase iron-sulfur subunit